MERIGTNRITGIALAALLALTLAGDGLADDWEDGRRDKLEQAVQDLEDGAVARERGITVERLRGSQDRNSLVSLRHGNVVLVGDLARADLTLEIQNTSAQPMEWRRSFQVDPQAEAIGAYLQRGTGAPVPAQTLTIADARRIYGEVREPRPTRTRPAPRRPSGDPLRIERPTRDQMDVVVWPIAPGETVRVGLEFVSPLRGRGASRRYVDPIQGDYGESAPPRRAEATAPDLRPAPVLASMDTHWVVDTGSLAMSDVPPSGMVAEGEIAGRHHFRSSGSGRPELTLRAARSPGQALAVAGGGLGTRVAVWRFDPVAFLEAHAIRVDPGCRVRLLHRAGSTSRIAPWQFAVTDEPVAVTARLLPKSHLLRYVVEVVDFHGNVRHRVDVEQPVDRTTLDPERSGAITGWHRAQLAQRVLAWAEGNPVRREQALDFAVDLGVLTEGTAALAVPENERRRLDRRSRQQYWQDGAPLGAQDREGDIKAPPPRSTGKAR